MEKDSTRPLSCYADVCLLETTVIVEWHVLVKIHLLEYHSVGM
jgi:hypothetical protein